MKLAYRIIAYVISLGVALQAASIALAFSGLSAWISGGNTVTRAVLTAETGGFPGQGGLGFHEVLGMMIMPVLGLALLVLGFFVKLKGAVLWGGVVLGSIVLQIAFAELIRVAWVFGALHGLFAFAVLAFATVAATRVARADRADRAA
jgi:hypothetical protein